MENMTTLDYPPSVNEIYDALINDRNLFESKILEMDENQVIAFYEYVLSLTRKVEEREGSLEQDSDNNLFYIKNYLEFLEVIENYLSFKEGRAPLTEEEERMIEETVRIIEERKHPSPLKRLIKYIKG